MSGITGAWDGQTPRNKSRRLPVTHRDRSVEARQNRAKVTGRKVQTTPCGRTAAKTSSTPERGLGLPRKGTEYPGESLPLVRGVEQGSPREKGLTYGETNELGKAPMSFTVMAETWEGKTLRLRKGFATRDEAEEHRVVASRWKRFWVEEETQDEVPSRRGLPPRPWGYEIVGPREYMYITDATGRKIATVWGSADERRHIRDAILKAMNQGA